MALRGTGSLTGDGTSAAASNDARVFVLVAGGGRAAAALNADTMTSAVSDNRQMSERDVLNRENINIDCSDYGVASIITVTGDCARAGPAKRQPAQIKLRSSILIK